MNDSLEKTLKPGLKNRRGHSNPPVKRSLRVKKTGEKSKPKLKVPPGGKGTGRTQDDKKIVIPVLDKISLLTNSYKYLLEHALILRYQGNKFRLLIIHEGKVLTDRPYKTIKAARIAFARFYSSRKWHEETEAEWSELYNPVKYYLDLRNNRIVGEQEDREMTLRTRKRFTRAQTII